MLQIKIKYISFCINVTKIRSAAAAAAVIFFGNPEILNPAATIIGV